MYVCMQVRLPACEDHEAYNDAAILKAEAAFEAEKMVCVCVVVGVVLLCVVLVCVV